jgi:hypothetical protein
MGWVLRLIDTDSSTPAGRTGMMEIGFTGGVVGAGSLGPTLSEGKQLWGRVQLSVRLVPAKQPR